MSEQDGKQAMVRRRVVDGVPTWGFDCAEGFANFGSKDIDKTYAAEGAQSYNSGEHSWSYRTIADCPEYAESQPTPAAASEAMGEDEQHITKRWAIQTDNRMEAWEARCSCGWKVRFAPATLRSAQMADEAMHDHHEKVFGPAARRMGKPQPPSADAAPEMEWRCENPMCRRVYAEYVNGCPACYRDKRDTTNGRGVNYSVRLQPKRDEAWWRVRAEREAGYTISAGYAAPESSGAVEKDELYTNLKSDIARLEKLVDEYREELNERKVRDIFADAWMAPYSKWIWSWEPQDVQEWRPIQLSTTGSWTEALEAALKFEESKR